MFTKTTGKGASKKTATIRTKAPLSERARDAKRKRQSRQSANVVWIPRPADLERRLRLEADDEAWLMYYFGPDSMMPDPFTYKFVEQQLEMIASIGHVMRYGGDDAKAASRGEGKTTLFERLLTKYTCQGLVDFSVLFASTGDLAEASLDSIKMGFEENVLLAADYPEICTPVASLEGVANRAGYAVCSGYRHDNGKLFEGVRAKFQWSGREIILPNIPGSPSARFIIATRGLDSAVRGIKRKGRRVKLAGIDDPDTEETATSEEQAGKLIKRIDRGIAGLGSQKYPIARIMLTSVQTSISASATFTDPTKKPTWRGRRFRFMIKPPTNMELWDEYVALYQEDNRQTALKERDDPHCRRSHQFYVDRFEEMNEGAVVANPNRFKDSILPDGTQTELTAIQHYYNRVARTSPEAVSAELDNDPVEVETVTDTGLTPHRIQKKVNGYARKAIPPDIAKLTRGIDVRKSLLHWVVRAWKSDGTPFTIDYGVYEIHGTKYGSDEGLDLAIERAILAYLEESKGAYERTIDRTCIDAAYRTEAIYSACRKAGPGVTPIMGCGKSAGCVQPKFHELQKRTRDKRPGNRYFLTKRPGGVWLCFADADHWKNFEHDRWLTPLGAVGSGTIFGTPHEKPDRLSPDERELHAYAHHICNEAEKDEVQPNGTIIRRFRAKSANTHWLDASYYSDVGASIEGIHLFGNATNAAATQEDYHTFPTLQELAGA